MDLQNLGGQASQSGSGCGERTVQCCVVVGVMAGDGVLRHRNLTN